jgi:MADS-box transcription enhancer factor 2A
MGRKKIEMNSIGDERIKKTTMKKRRIGLLKKAIQLSKLTDARIYLKIFTPQDELLLEYISKE